MAEQDPGAPRVRGQAALDAVWPEVYQELRRLAGYYVRGERPDLTLQPTALVHEAYVRLLREANLGGVSERVQLLGYTDEKYIAPLYRQCLAHVFPSSYEGFGLTVLEAMACGAPTLTTAFSSLGEVAGDAALTLRELEVEPFALELRRLVSDQALQQDLRARGLAHARHDRLHDGRERRPAAPCCRG